MGIPDTCTDYRCLTTCQKQHRQNDPAGQVDIPTRVEVHVMGDLDMCRDHRCLTVKNQNRQNEPAGQVDIPTRVEVCVMSHSLSKTTQTGWRSMMGDQLCPQMVDRMNQLVY